MFQLFVLTFVIILINRDKLAESNTKARSRWNYEMFLLLAFIALGMDKLL